MREPIVKLSHGEIEAQLPGIPGWEYLNGRLRREFQFSDFSTAFAFMTRAALVSEKYNHHPEWLNVYNTVRIDLITHEAGGITERDMTWARAANRIFESSPALVGPTPCCG